MRKRRRVAGRTRWLRDAERRQRLSRDDPGRDRAAEALAEERSQRLRLPLLDVARRPVVEQTEPEKVARRLRNRDRLAERVPGSDPHREFQLVIELATRAVARRLLARRLALAARTPNRHARGPHRRRPAVIGHRHVFVVRAQWIVRIPNYKYVPRVVDAGEEIGVAAD